MIFIDNKNNIFTAKGLFRASQLFSNLILKTYQNKIQIVDSISSISVKGKNVIMENGESFFLADENSVLTSKGISKVELLNEKMYLGFKANSFFSPIANKEIEWVDELRTKSIPIKVPTSMDINVAYWFGIYSARGYFDEKNGTVFFNVQKNKELKNIVIKLTKEIFDVTPDSLKEDSNNILAFHSNNVKRFIKKQFGKKGWKKIPTLIQESSLDEQLAYLAGLSFKSFQDKNGIIFSSSSSLFMNYLSSLIKNLGFLISRRSTLSGSGNLVHYINVIGRTREIPLDELKAFNVIFNSKINLDKLKKNFLVKVPNLSNIKVKKKNPSYGSFINYKKEKRELGIAYILDNWEIPYEKEIYYIKIKKIEDIEKRCTAVILKNQGGLLLENLIIFE